MILLLFLHSFFSVPPRLNSITEFPTPFICLLTVFSLWTSGLCPCSFLVCQKTFSFVYFLNLSPKRQANAQWDKILYEVFCMKCKCDFIIFWPHFISRHDSMKCCCVENKVKQACNNKSKSESHIWLNKNSQLGQSLFETATYLVFVFDSLRRNLLNWCNLVSISKKWMFYISGVVRIY